MRAFVAIPDGPRPAAGWPVVVAIHDALGFSDDIRRIVRRFASSGHAALAPALYDGAGAPLLCVVRTFRDLARGQGPAFDRLDAARRFAAAQAEPDGARIGVTGFCMGGGFSLLWAARGGLRVCAPYYGDCPPQADALRNVCPVVAGFGELDRPFAAAGRRLERHLETLDVPHDVKIYPGVGHSYMNDHGMPMVAAVLRRTPMHAAHDPDAAEDSWRRMLAFFAVHL